MLLRAIYGREERLVQDHLAGSQEGKGNLVDNNLTEEVVCKTYSVLIAKGMGILNPIVGHKIKVLKGVQAVILRMKGLLVNMALCLLYMKEVEMVMFLLSGY